MIKTITESDLDTLINFIGYGNLDADIWFLGKEETISSSAMMIDRLQFEQVEDSTKALSILNLSASDFWNTSLNGNMQGLSELMLKLSGEKITGPKVLNYAMEHLGKADDASLLCFLLPLPVTRETGEDFQKIFPQYSSREEYLEEIRPLRLDFFRQLVASYHPRVIIAYGKDAWTDYKELFQDYKLNANGDFMLGWSAETVIILCDNFTSAELAGKLDELFSLIQKNSLDIRMDKRSGSDLLSKAEIARQQKEIARKAALAKRKPARKHNPADPYCVCEYCLGYETD